MKRNRVKLQLQLVVQVIVNMMETSEALRVGILKETLKPRLFCTGTNFPEQMVCSASLSRVRSS
jgi:hypothetical protein